MHMDGRRWTKSSGGEILPRILESICNGLFPRRCPVCDELLEPEEVSKRIHTACEAKLYPVMGTCCMHCGRPLEGAWAEFCHDCAKRPESKSGYITDTFIQGKSVYLYQGPIKKAMYRLKYSNRREYADFFAEKVVERYAGWIRDKGIQAIVPVPMYRPKQRRRGYNQAETIARALGRLLNLPVEAGLIRRIKDTKPQKELNDVQRKNNLKSAFQKTESIVQYTHILVVDDIYTTGSTADAVAAELMKTKVEAVYFLSICIGEGM